MISGLSLPILANDIAPQSANDGAKAGAGAAFGAEMKNAAEKHEQHSEPASEPRDGDEARADGKIAPRKGVVFKPSHKDVERRAGEDESPIVAEDGGSATDDLLGRLLAGAGFPLAASAERHQGTTGADEPEGDAGEGDNGLEERIVISTVADLNGVDPSADTAADKRIALRVTRMETHFEPKADAATLIDVAEADTLGETAAPSGKPDAPAGPKPAFEEVLQRLGRGEMEGSNDQSASDQDARNRPAETQADMRRSSRGEDQAERGTSPLAKAANVADQPKKTLGEIINAQVAERIIGAFASETPVASSATSASAPTASGQLLRMTAGGAALKTLSIQLEPQDLGRVDVSMRLVDGRLAVELVASEPSTAQALASDHHGLRKILEHAGFALDDAAITVVARDLGQGSPASQGAAPSSDDRGSGQGSANGQPGARSDGRNGESGREERRSRPPVTADTTAERRRASGGSVYL